jgi:hypothetical protein
MTDVAVEEIEEVTVVPDEMSPELRALFTFSTWVHVGLGAEECDAVDTEAGTNGCVDPAHIHVWCRLPNGLQLRVIAEKARAAKARRARELRDDQTDSHAVLEDEVADLIDAGEKEPLVDVLVGREWFKHYLRARNEVEATEAEPDEDDGPFAHIDDDQERLLAISRMPEADQPKDERESLDKHVRRYQDLVEAKLEEYLEPEREGLRLLEMEALVERVRRDLIQQDAMAVFQHEYAIHEWLLCTTDAPHGKRRWMTAEDMENEPPELIDTVKDAYERLEREQRTLTQGKAS